MRRDGHDADVVDLVELGGLGLRRTGHAGQRLVEAEVVLQRDRGEGLVLLLDLDAFLRLDRLVHALVVAAAVQDAAGELVDDQDLVLVRDDVVLVALVELLGLQRVVEVADQRRVRRLVQVVDAEPVLDPGHAALGDRDRALGLVDLVVALAALLRRAPGGATIRANSAYQRADCSAGPEMISGVRASSIRIESTSSTIAKLWPRWTRSSARHGHVVAQVVEAELVVRAVGDVALVRRALCSPPDWLGRITPTVRPRNRCTCPIHSASRWAR